MSDEQRRNSGGGWLGLIGKLPLLRSWGGGNGEPNSENTDFRGGGKGGISGSRKRKKDYMGEAEVENVHVDGHSLRKPSFQMPLDASPMRRRGSVKASASAATTTVTKGSGNRSVGPGGEKEESNRKKKVKVMQEADERCSGLPPSINRSDEDPTCMDLQRFVELEGGCDQVLGLLKKAVVAVPDDQDDMRALSRGEQTPQDYSTLSQDVQSTPTAMNTARWQQQRHDKLTTAEINDDRQWYNSSRGIMYQGMHATSTPVGAFKSKKGLMRIDGERILDSERRISTQSSAKAARCILDSLKDMSSPVEVPGNLGLSLLYTDSVFRDNRRWGGGGGLSALPSKSSTLRGPPPPLKSIASESIVHGGPSDTTLVVTRGRRNGNSAATQRQQLSQEAVAEIPRLERKRDGGESPKWQLEPSHPSSSYTPARDTSRGVQVSSSSLVLNVADNSIKSPSPYSLERWQPPPKRQRATMVREQQTQTEDIGDETWDVQKASLRGVGRHLTMGGVNLSLPRLLSKEKETNHDDKLKRKGTSVVAASISPRRHSAGRFSLIDKSEGEEYLDTEDDDATPAGGWHIGQQQPPLSSGQPERDLKDNGDFVFTAPKAVVAPALDLCKSQISTEDSRVDAPKFSFTGPLENRRLSVGNDETNSRGINDTNKLPFSFNQIKSRSNVKKLNAPVEQKTPLPISKNDDSTKQTNAIQDQKTDTKKKLDTSPVKGFDMSRFRPKPGYWKCSSCLVTNPDSSVKCMACEVDKPVAENSNGGEKGAATRVSFQPPTLPSPPSTSSATDLPVTKVPTPVKDKPFNFELPPGGIVVSKGGNGLGPTNENTQLNLNPPPATENVPSFASQEADTASETTTASKAPFTFGGSAAVDVSSFKSKPLSASAEIFTPSTNLGVAGSSVDPIPSTTTTSTVNPVGIASKTDIPSGSGFTFGSTATIENASKPSTSFPLSSASGFSSSSPAVLPTVASDSKMDSEAAVPSHADGMSAAAPAVTSATPTETVPGSAPGVTKSAPFLFGAPASSTPTIPTSPSSSKPTKLPTLAPSFTFGAAPAEKPTESSAAKTQSDGKGDDKSAGAAAITKPAFTFGATPAAAPAPASSPSPLIVQQPKPAFSFNAPVTAPSPAFGGTSTTSSAVFGGGALSAVSSPPQPGQTFSFNATGVSSGGVQSQNASTVMPSPAAAPSFVFGSTTPDSQPQQQQQPAFSFGAGSGVVGQSGMAFGQSTSPTSPPGTDGGQFGGFGTKSGGGFPIPQQSQPQQQQPPVSFGGFSSQQQPAPQVGGMEQPGPSFGTPMGFGSGAAPGVPQQKQPQSGGFSMGVGASHTAKAGGTRGGRKFLKCKRRLGK